MTEDEQMNQAIYTIDKKARGTQEETEEESFYFVSRAGEEFFLAGDTTAFGGRHEKARVDALREWGVPIVRRVAKGTIPKDQGETFAKLKNALWPELMKLTAEAGSSFDRAYFLGEYGSFSCLTIKTPTRLGAGVHLAKRRVAEKVLRELGYTFTVQCQTVHPKSSCELVMRDG